MGRFMVLIPSAIVSGGVIGIINFRYNLSEDQVLTVCFVTAAALLYITKDLE